VETDVNFDQLHAWTFDAIYLCAILLTFVLIERFLYFIYIWLGARRIAAAIAVSLHETEAPAGQNLFARAIRDYVTFQQSGSEPRARVDDLSNALVLGVDARLHARLWVLDTIVTAAPLLGLLGTIFGIMQTFGALSAGGISDPASVSRGIGTALQATALGIATALYGLIAHNALHRQAEHLSDRFKVFLLRTTK
jgi:biopolymer transport protein ExbB